MPHAYLSLDLVFVICTRKHCHTPEKKKKSDMHVSHKNLESVKTLYSTTRIKIRKEKKKTKISHNKLIIASLSFIAHFVKLLFFLLP